MLVSSTVILNENLNWIRMIFNCCNLFLKSFEIQLICAVQNGISGIYVFEIWEKGHNWR